MFPTQIDQEILLPRDFKNAKEFGDTLLRCHEAERMLQLIINYQLKKSPDAWSAFSFEEYRSGAKHAVHSIEEVLLETLVRGGKIDDTKKIRSGCLAKDETGRYVVTKKFLKIVKHFAVY